MIFLPGEVAQSIRGAWRLFLGDASGIEAFDTSIDGFWRSFAVIILLIPAVVILMAAERMDILGAGIYAPENFPQGVFIASRVIGTAIDWVSFPLVLALLAKPLGLSARYVPLVVALNWTSIISVLPATIPALLLTLGFVDMDSAIIMAMVGLGIAIRYQYIVTRAATGASISFSIGLVVLSYVISIGMDQLIASLVGV